jgi:hypothetical protein
MFRSLAFSVLSLLAFSVHAQQTFETEIPVICGDGKNIIDGLREKFEEEILFMAPSKNAQGDDLFHSLWVNHSKGSWSFIVLNKQKGIVCILGSGEDGKSFIPTGI